MLARRLPFLQPTVSFRAYHELAGEQAYGSGNPVLALRGVRPVTADFIGAWRAHPGRVRAQMMIHGDICDELCELGYEADRSWLALIEGAEPDWTESVTPERLTLGARARWALRRQRGTLYYLLRRYVLGLIRR